MELDSMSVTTWDDIKGLAISGWQSTLGVNEYLWIPWLVTAIVIFVVVLATGFKKDVFGGLVVLFMGWGLSYFTWWQIYVLVMSGLLIPWVVLGVLDGFLVYLGLKGEKNFYLIMAAGFIAFFFAGWMYLYPMDWAWAEIW